MLVDFSTTINFITLYLITFLSLTPAFALTSEINSLKSKKLVSAEIIKIYFFIFTLNFSSYTKLFVSVFCTDYDLILSLS